MSAVTEFMRDDLRAGAVPAGVEALSEALRRRYRDAVHAIVLYGSCRRRGDAREGLVDLMVLISSYRAVHGTGPAALANALLPPNVYYLEADASRCAPADETAGAGPARIRCKYTLLTESTFQRRCRGGLDGYFWARFAQPARLVWCAGDAVLDRVASARAAAARTFASRVAPLLDGRCAAHAFWQRALVTSYGCELRPESPAAAAALIDAERHYWDALSARVLPETAGVAADGDGYRFTPTAARRRQARAGWALRRIWGKLLNVLRLFKAAGTFSNGIDYLLWKAERHSGVRVEANEWMRRHPRRAAWRLAWTLWRQGAFR